MPPTLIPPSDAAHAAVSMFLIVASVAFLLIGVQVRRHSRQLEALRRAQDANSRVVYTQLSGKEARLQTLVVAVNDLGKELAVVRGAGDVLAEQFAGFAASTSHTAQAALALAMESQERCEALEDGCEVLGQALREATAGRPEPATPARTIPNGVFRAIGSVERTNEEEA